MIPGDVHIWRVPLDQDAAQLDPAFAWLSADERARAARFRFHTDRRRFIAARGALRAILAGYLGIHAARIEFTYGPHGKPQLKDPALDFNVSHSSHQALVAVSFAQPVGVDIEELRPFRRAGERPMIIFSNAELAEFQALPPSEQDRAFYNAWTRKEAFVKATGTGFHTPVADVEVVFRPGAPARLLRLHGDAEPASSWTLVDLAAPPGFVAALAVEGPIRHVQMHAWPTLNRG